MRALRLQLFDQPFKVTLRRADPARLLHLTQANRVCNRDRILVDVQSNVQCAKVFHAGLRAGNSLCTGSVPMHCGSGSNANPRLVLPAKASLAAVHGESY